MESYRRGKRGYYDDGFKFEFLKLKRSDFHCILCDVHMNSLLMWESHISGRKHQTNLKRRQGELSSEKKRVEEEVTPLIQEALDCVPDAVGLSFVTELRQMDSSIPPYYSCCLCQETVRSDIIGHLVSAKHRLNFLKEVDPKSFELIEGLQLSNSAKETAIGEKAVEWAATYGRGRIEVKLDNRNASYFKSNKHKEIGSSSAPPAKRMHDGVQSDSPGTSSVSQLETASTVVAEPEFDMDTIASQLSYDTKLEMLSYMIPRIVVESDEDARKLRHIINCFLQLNMQYRLRQLSRDQQISIARDITSDSLPTVDEGLAEVVDSTKLIKYGKFCPNP